jgi:hypothetical protein
VERLRVRRLLLNWLPPVVIVVALLLGISSRVSASTAPNVDALTVYLQTHQLDLGNQEVKGYQQIYYIYNGERVFITEQGYNHVYAGASGQYIAWEGLLIDGGQIFLHNILTNSTIQLTSIGTNVEPSIYQDKVVWRSWDGVHWQLYYYDGLQIIRITNDNYSSIHASVNASQIIYAKQLSADDWQAESYNLATGQTSVIRRGDEASTAYPAFKSDGSVSTAFVRY